MLIRFEVGNYRSIWEPVELSMVAVDRGREGVKDAAIAGTSLLQVVGIYGANASGKSNVLSALAWVRRAVLTSLREWDEAIPVEPFAMVAGRPEPMAFALDVAVNGIRYEYLCEVDAERVQYEALYEYPKLKRRRVFERDGGSLTMQRELSELAAIKTLMTPRSLVLSLLRRFESLSAVSAVVGTLQDMRLAQPLSSPIRWWRPSPGTIELFADEPQEPLFGREDPQQYSRTRQQALKLLRKADLGIEDVRVEPVLDSRTPARDAHELMLTHRSGSSRFELDFAQESMGTKIWLSLIAPILTVLKTGGLLVVDELDASLHPTLTSEVLKLFLSASSNPLGAQLLFSTHDTNLLNLLNRDEVWFTEKGREGSTRLGSLAEFKGGRVREGSNLERGYLAGRFGGLPDMQPGDLVRALMDGSEW